MTESPYRSARTCSVYKSRLECLALPDDPNIPEHKKFFCASKLRDFFSQQVVADLLSCPCHKCSLLRPRLGLSQNQIHDATKRVSIASAAVSTNPGSQGGRSNRTHHLTLGLLLYIDYLALVLSFAHHKLADTELATVLDQSTPEGLKDRFWSKLRLDSADEPLLIARKLRWQRYRFFLPKLRAGEFSIYDENAILPFLNERKIGLETLDGDVLSEGAYGQIYAFDMPEEYHDFKTSAAAPRRFVRKELRDNSHSGIFQAERRNLDYIRRIKDDHIITVLKAYKHGVIGNIVFPEARTNLGHYLRDARHGASDVTCSPRVEDHPFWAQAIGLARALHKILNYEAEDESRNEVLYGYHFDLKPANILIGHGGDFIISDFGQAHFRKAGATSSKVVGFGGTESYAPPEFDDSEARQNRKYDIWSLGCIYLEITTFIILGQAGVHELDRLRLHSSHDASRVDDRFILRRHDEWYLKPSIMNWMDQLIEQTSPDGSRAFVHQVIDLIHRMLTVNVETRCTSMELCCTLSDIFNQQDHSTTSTLSNLPDNQQTEVTTPFASMEVGAEAMSRVKALRHHHQGYWNSGQIRLTRTAHQLDLYSRQSKEWHKIPIGDARYLRLVPLYALKDATQHRYKDSSIYLQSRTDLYGDRPACEQLYSESLADILYSQEALLGQKVLQHLEAASVVLVGSSSSSISGTFPVRLLGQASKSSNTLTELCPNIQLWSDGFRVREGSNLQTQSFETDIHYIHPVPRRIVIFSPSRIHIIQMNDSVRLTEDDSQVTTSSALYLRPTRKASNGAFECLTINKGPTTLHPGLPMSNQSLQFEEDRKSKPHTMIKIVFGTPQDMEKFKKMYRSLKYRWELEQKQCLKAEKEIGPKLGLAPNAR